jgi:cathepsin F
MKTQTLFVLLLFIFKIIDCRFQDSVITDDEIFKLFTNFTATYNKNYKTIDHYTNSFNIYKENYLNIINTHTNKSYTLGQSPFMDISKQYFKKTYLNLRTKALSTYNKLENINGKVIPSTFDWRNLGAVGPIKDQGDCGSCWAFSVVGNIESQYYLNKDQLIQFSEQQVIDCDEYDDGCNGGIQENAFNYIYSYGLESQSNYPYISASQTCQYKENLSDVKLSHYINYKDVNEDDLMVLLVQNGPLTLAMNGDFLQFYSNGILDEDYIDCDPDNLNQGVILVGYGSEEGHDYWIVRNSWGVSWGESGYFRVSRGKSTCGINKQVSTAVLG